MKKTAQQAHADILAAKKLLAEAQEAYVELRKKENEEASETLLKLRSMSPIKLRALKRSLTDFDAQMGCWKSERPARRGYVRGGNSKTRKYRARKNK